MTQRHARSRVAHHLANARLGFTTLAVNLAILAIALVTERACLRASQCGIDRIATRWAQSRCIFGAVVVRNAVDAANCLKRFSIFVGLLAHVALFPLT